MQVFEADSADRVWLSAVDALKQQAALPRQEGRGGTTSEILHAAMQISNPRQRWVVSRSPGMSVAFAIVEVIGIMNGRQDSAYLNFFNPRLPHFAGSGPLYHGAYGFRLRQNCGFDQLDRAFKALRSNADGRQIVLQIWDAAKDFPREDGSPVATDIPCNVCSMLKIRNDRLEWVQVMRSNDIFKGVPYNFVQFTALQEVLAGWLAIEPGTYTHFSDSLHVYDDDLAALLSSVPVFAPANNDSIAYPKDIADPIWSEMNRRVDILCSRELSDLEYVDMATLAGAPQAFNNLMAIVVADAARRRAHFSAAEKTAQVCSNPLLTLLWTRWVEWKKPARPERGPSAEGRAQSA